MPSNPRLTNRDNNLIKSAINRAFSRSELRKQVVEAAIIDHTDLTRPRVKKWCKCAICKKPTPKSYIEVDHIKPKILPNESFKEMSLDDYVDKTWCDISNLQPLCPECHEVKTQGEKKLKKEYLKLNKKSKPKKKKS